MIRRLKQAAMEADCLKAFTPAFDLHRPKTVTCPVIFASPHSGSVYPKSFESFARLSLAKLRQNEDAFIDELYAVATDHGAPLLAARFPRCFVDVNRAADEFPDDWPGASPIVTQRAELGLGVVPTHIGEDMPIYRRAFPPEFAAARIDALYHPYHAALQDLIKAAKTRFGHAVVIDCHSMPGFDASGSRRADVILGDRHRMSCKPRTIGCLERLFKERGYHITRNYPYAGGYVAAHYGRPEEDVEVIQIELNRDLYLNPVTLARKKGYDTLARNIEAIVTDFTDAYRQSESLAAE